MQEAVIAGRGEDSAVGRERGGLDRLLGFLGGSGGFGHGFLAGFGSLFRGFHESFEAWDCFGRFLYGFFGPLDAALRRVGVALGGSFFVGRFLLGSSEVL